MVYVTYVHNPESAWKILQTRLKKRNGRLGEPGIVTLDSSMKKMAAGLKAKGKNPGSTRGLLSCQGKEPGVLFRLNYSIHQHTGIGCNTSS